MRTTRPLHIAVDGRVLGHRGVGRYLANTLQAAAQIKHPHRFIVYLGPSSKAELLPKDPRFSAQRLEAKHPAIAEQWTLPRRAKVDGADLIFYPDNSGAIHPGMPMVLGLLDTMWQRPLAQAIARPTFRQRIQDRYRKFVCPRAAAAATAVVTISQHSARCIDEALGVRAPKLSVVDLAADPGLRTVLPTAQAQRLRAAMGLKPGQRYILGSGAADKRKNVDRLIQAFAQARRSDKRLRDAVLVITSLRPGEGATTTYVDTARAAGVMEALHFVGYVDDRQMKALYQGALCFAFPSLWEGFGLPVLEAFALGCPVLISGEGSLPEVGAKAAVYADPYDVKDLARGIVEASFGARRAALIRAGKQREKGYTWLRCAQDHLKAFEKAAASARP